MSNYNPTGRLQFPVDNTGDMDYDDQPDIHIPQVVSPIRSPRRFSNDMYDYKPIVKSPRSKFYEADVPESVIPKSKFYEPEPEPFVPVTLTDRTKYSPTKKYTPYPVEQNPYDFEKDLNSLKPKTKFTPTNSAISQREMPLSQREMPVYRSVDETVVTVNDNGRKFSLRDIKYDDGRNVKEKVTTCSRKGCQVCRKTESPDNL